MLVCTSHVTRSTDFVKSLFRPGTVGLPLVPSTTMSSRSNRKRKRSKSNYKRCRCNPGCYKIISWATRKRHYQLADEATVLPSDFGSDVDGATDIDDVSSLQSSVEDRPGSVLQAIGAGLGESQSYFGPIRSIDLFSSTAISSAEQDVSNTDVDTSEDPDLPQSDIAGIDIDFGELFSGSDEYPSDDINSDGDRISYEGDISSDEMLAAEEMIEDLEACMGPEQDEAFWNIRTFSPVFTVYFIY